MEPRIISFKPKQNFTKYGYYNEDSSPTSMDHSQSTIVPSSIIVNDILLSAPPTFSRLPPDGHEFPPNFSEPIILTAIKQTETPITTTTPKSTINKSTIKDDSKYQSAREDPPPLPKSVPPPLTAPRKIYRQDIVINVDDKRSENNNENIIPLDATNLITSNSNKFEWSPAAVLEDKSVRKEIMITAKNGHLSKITQSTSAVNTDNLTNAAAAARRRSIENYDAFKKFDPPKRQIGTLPANWRKDEKSEKSVRDKIAMFSNDNEDDVIIPLPNNHVAEKIVLGPRKSLNKSTENLLSDNYMRTRKITDVNAHTSLAKKAQSVENLDEYNQHQKLHRKSSLNTSNNSIYSNDKYTIQNSVKSSLCGNNNNNSSPTYNINKFGKAYSVDNLNNQNSSPMMKVDNLDNNNHHMKHSGNYQSQPIVSATYGTLPRTIKHPPASVSRTTSFSAHGKNGIAYDDRNRRSSVSNILEQRKKSMSKLRGLIIPERTALGEEPTEPVLLDLPEIKNNDASKAKSYATYSPYGIHSPVNNNNHNNNNNNNKNNNKHTYLKKSEPVVPNPRHYTSAYQSVISPYTPTPTLTPTPTPTPTPTHTPITNTNNYQRIYCATNRTLFSSINKQPNASTILPPVKPPRASLLSTSRSPLSDLSPPVHPKLPIDESEDSDSVFSSKISSPPNSPIVTSAPPEKFVLTRTLSSETNTSIASSSTSTLTSGSAGSQASCSSVGSTPTIDMSRKINKSSSNESYVNRKNILASAKCRSGKDESLLFMNNGHRQQHHHHHHNQQHQQQQHHHQPQQRYDDEDSTDGYDEEEFRRHHHPKPKQRNSVVTTLNNNNQKIIANQSTLSNNNKNVNNNIIDSKKPINYKLITNEDNIRDMVINVASYIEVTSDTDADSSKQSDSSLIKQNIRFIDEERRASFKSPVVQKSTNIITTITSPLVPVRASKISNQTPLLVATPVPRLSERITPTAVIAQEKLNHSMSENNDLAKWVRNEVAKNDGRIDDKINMDKQKNPIEIKTFNRLAPVKMSVLENIQKFNKDSSNAELPKIPSNVELPKTIVGVTRGATSPAITTESKKNRNNDVRTHSIDTKSNALNTTNITPIKSPKDKTSTAACYHERFSSLDSLASSSSGISSTQTPNSTQAINPTLSSNSGECSSHNLESTPTDFGSFSSFGSNHSLITAADLQLLIEEADPPLKTPEAIVVVLQRESPESSVGVTLAGGSDYEAKEITIHRILTNSPAYKDGRLKKGDRILSINGLSMRGLTHRESVTVLKTPRQEVVMVITRSESVLVQTLMKTKRSSLGSLSSLNEKPINGNSSETAVIDRRKSYHKTSRSLDLDLDIVSNDAIQDENKSIDGTEESTSSSAGDDAVFGASTNTASDARGIKREVYSQSLSKGSKMVEIYKDNCGLGLAIEGGQDSPNGHQPLIVKKIFMGGAAEKTGQIKVGDIIVWINDFSTENMTRVQAWNYMKSLPSGPVKFVFS